jgi:predicted nucleotidyltransferase
MITKFDESSIVSMLRERLGGLKLVYLFGSQASGGATPESDVDLGVCCSAPVDPLVRYELEQDLAVELSRDVDLVDMVVAGDVVNKEIVENGVLLFGNTDSAERYELKVYSDYQAHKLRVADLESDLLRV